MLRTRAWNEFMGTAQTMEEVAAMNWLWFEIMAATRQALYPEPGG